MNRTLSVSGGIFLLSLAIIQMALGASALSVVFAVSSALVPLVPILIYGLGHPVGLTFLMMAMFAGISPLLLKTAILSPIDAGLFVPELSWTVVFLGVLAAVAGVVAAYPLARHFTGVTKLNPSDSELRMLAILSIGLFFLLFMLAGAGGILKSIKDQIGNVIIFGLICETVRTIRVSKYTRSISFVSIFIFSVIFVSTVGSNSKAGFGFAGIAFLVTCLSCGYRFQIFHAVLGITGLIYLTSVVFPVIHTVRGNRANLEFTEMLELTANTIVGYTFGDPISSRLVESTVNRSDARFIGAYQVSYVANNNFTDRFTLIAISDAILRTFENNDSFVGYEFYKNELINLLPFVGGEFSMGRSAGDFILAKKGFANRDIASRISIPFPAEAFAMDGFRGVLIIVTMTFFILAFTFSWFLAPITSSVWTVYFFANKIFLLPGSHAGGIFSIATRGLLNDLALFIIVLLALFTWRIVVHNKSVNFRGMF